MGKTVGFPEKDEKADAAEQTEDELKKIYCISTHILLILTKCLTRMGLLYL